LKIYIKKILKITHTHTHTRARARTHTHTHIILLFRKLTRVKISFSLRHKYPNLILKKHFYVPAVCISKTGTGQEGG